MPMDRRVARLDFGDNKTGAVGDAVSGGLGRLARFFPGANDRIVAREGIPGGADGSTNLGAFEFDVADDFLF